MKEPECPLVRKWLDKPWSIHALDIVAAGKLDDPHSFIYQVFTEDPQCAGTGLGTADGVDNKLKSLLTWRSYSNLGRDTRH